MCRRSDWGHLQFQASDVNAGRKRAREEAAIAKAAGFEWVNVSVNAHSVPFNQNSLNQYLVDIAVVVLVVVLVVTLLLQCDKVVVAFVPRKCCLWLLTSLLMKRCEHALWHS